MPPLEQILDLLADCQAAYHQADLEIRRHWNQAVFERLWLLDDRVIGAELKTPFAEIITDDLTQRSP